MHHPAGTVIFPFKLISMTAPRAPKPTIDQRVVYLLHRHLQMKITRTEHTKLDAWVGASDDHILLYEVLTDQSFLEALAIDRPLIEAFIARYDPRG